MKYIPILPAESILWVQTCIPYSVLFLLVHTMDIWQQLWSVFIRTKSKTKKNQMNFLKKTWEEHCTFLQIVIRHMCYIWLCFSAFTAPNIQWWYHYCMFKASLVHIKSSKAARLKQGNLNSKNVANSHETYPWNYRYDNMITIFQSGLQEFTCNTLSLFLLPWVSFI